MSSGMGSELMVGSPRQALHTSIDVVGVRTTYGQRIPTLAPPEAALLRDDMLARRRERRPYASRCTTSALDGTTIGSSSLSRGSKAWRSSYSSSPCFFQK